MILSSLTFAVTIASVLSQTDWCSPDLCGPLHHIICNNDGEFSAACGDSPEILEMTEARKQSILDAHNSYRNIAATGNEAQLPEAARMQTMKWDDDLALGAEYNVKQCVIKHDECRNTKQFLNAGQNLGYLASTSDIDGDETIVGIIDRWYDEGWAATVDQIKMYPKDKPEHPIERYAAMIQDKSGYIGCAVSTYRSTNRRGERNNLLLVCNMAYANVAGQPVYAIGPTGSECKTGVNAKYPGLCSDDEVVVLPDQ